MPESSLPPLTDRELQVMFDSADPDTRIEDREAAALLDERLVKPDLQLDRSETLSRISQMPPEEFERLLGLVEARQDPGAEAVRASLELQLNNPDMNYTLPPELSKTLRGDSGFTPHEWLELDNDTRRTLLLGLADM